MKPLILLLAAAALIGAAPARHAQRYEAGGFEPSWRLDIDGARLTFNPGTTEPAIRILVPRRQPVRNGYRLVSPRLTVDVRHVRCDGYDARTWTDTVLVTVHGRTNEGCGGTPIAPARLDHSNWYIRSIGGTRLPSDTDDWKVEFADGRIVVRLRCHEYEGSYRERRPVLTLGALAATRRSTSCASPAPERRALEQHALAILRGPLRISFVEGDTLILAGPGGAIRLFPLA